MSVVPSPTVAESLARWQESSRLAGVELEWIAPSELPSPDRDLLEHDRDMTSTLARFHGDTIELEVIQSQNQDDHHFREVVLHAAKSGEPVEYGLIEVHLASFPPPVRETILEGREPLGGLLNASGTGYLSSPLGYFRVNRECIGELFPPSRGKFLFGRYNQLSDPSHRCLARILEILPERPNA